MTVGEVLRTLRVSKGLKQAELAERAGVSVSSVSLAENNKRDPSIKWLRKIAPILGVPAGVLFAAAMAIDDAEAANPRAQEIAQKLVSAATALLLEERLHGRLDAVNAVRESA